MTPDESEDDGADSDGSEILFGLPPAHTDHGLPDTYFQEGGAAELGGADGSGSDDGLCLEENANSPLSTLTMGVCDAAIDDDDDEGELQLEENSGATSAAGVEQPHDGHDDGHGDSHAHTSTLDVEDAAVNDILQEGNILMGTCMMACDESTEQPCAFCAETAATNAVNAWMREAQRASKKAEAQRERERALQKEQLAAWEAVERAAEARERNGTASE